MFSNSFGLKMFRSRLWNVLPLAAAGVPPLIIVVTVARYGLNVPFLDQWALLDLLDNAAREALR